MYELFYNWGQSIEGRASIFAAFAGFAVAFNISFNLFFALLIALILGFIAYFIVRIVKPAKRLQQIKKTVNEDIWKD